ncbi:hypothetical protein PN462_19965 [Spirulina sp. CS-785/01]|uniref:hypothetical protein n=1 Tax=Spirulina sp. CS-785/01 TaxID=3021716 RepID=UPI00232BB3C6|nr:hypothetical protein [Spirulina sp. CS-785/01]MDB9315402.1 hypothetical protein [Spirulina sp. CS-785/01]
MSEPRTNYDSPWKDAIEAHFPQFLDFFFPQIYNLINWDVPQPYEFLESELQQLEPDAEIGTRFVDKIVKVWLLSGEQVWVLIHIEVQQKSRGTPPPRNRWGRKAGESIPLLLRRRCANDAAETHNLLGYA